MRGLGEARLGAAGSGAGAARVQTSARNRRSGADFHDGKNRCAGRARLLRARGESVDVKIIAVIGAGAMGRGISCAAVVGGYRTILEDVSSPVREQGLQWIRRSLEEGVALGEVTPQLKDDALALLSTARSVEEACREA